MNFKIAVLAGDGIGPEVTAEAQKAMVAIAQRFGHSFEFTEGLAGGAAIDAQGTPMTDETLELCQQSDAILFGAVGGPKWDNPKIDFRPEQALFRLRKTLDLFANLRPVRAYQMLAEKSPLRPEVLQGSDIIVVRELAGGLYFGKPKERWETEQGRRAVDTMDYSDWEVSRIVRVACELARKRSKKVTSVDKFNALISGRLWRQVATEIGEEYPNVEVSHMLADTFAMQLVTNPSTFDVIVTGNMFGDIFTDEAAVLAGSMGLLPSASISGLPTGRTLGMYEPIHGSAPTIAGQGIANPLAAILSAALLLRYSLDLETEAKTIEDAVMAVLVDGYRTDDILTAGANRVGTRQMGDLVVEKLRT